MISSTLGAPLGGTTVAGQPGLELAALRLILPVNGGGGFGRYLPSIVVVALGDPGAPFDAAAADAELVAADGSSAIAKSWFFDVPSVKQTDDLAFWATLGEFPTGVRADSAAFDLSMIPEPLDATA
jgi:hypothetical protein